MIQIYSADQRIQFNDEWLNAHHHFNMNFVESKDSGWGKLKVFNDDIIAPGYGFEMHPHRNMDIISIVIEGTLEHRDSLSNHYLLNAGQMQVMHCGKGIMHAEFNHSKVNSLRVLQVWLDPIKLNVDAHSFFVKSISQFPLPAISGRDNSIYLNSDVELYFWNGFVNDTFFLHECRAFLYVISGDLLVQGHKLSNGDALMLNHENLISLYSQNTSVVLFINL